MFEILFAVIGIVGVVEAWCIAWQIHFVAKQVHGTRAEIAKVAKEVGELSIRVGVGLWRPNYQPTSIADQYKSQYEKALAEGQKLCGRGLSGT